VPVDVRLGQLWEFANGAAPVRRAIVERVTGLVDDVRYVSLKRVGSGRPMRTTLHRLRYQQRGARLAEDVPVAEGGGRALEPITDDEEEAPPRAKVHEPCMSVAERREAVALAHGLHARGRGIAEIAETLCASTAVVRVWLAEQA